MITHCYERAQEQKYISKTNFFGSLFRTRSAQIGVSISIAANVDNLFYKLKPPDLSTAKHWRWYYAH